MGNSIEYLRELGTGCAFVALAVSIVAALLVIHFLVRQHDKKRLK